MRPALRTRLLSTLTFAATLVTRVATAEPTCVTVKAFNEQMEAEGSAAESVVLRFDLAGVDLGDYVDAKGWIADLVDGSCSTGTGATAALKVYGTQTTPNVAHPPGTVKLEHGSACCAAPPCSEHWAEPNPGPVVFTGPTQACNVEIRVKPSNVGYTLICGGQTFVGDSENAAQLKVSKVWLLSLAGGQQPMENATATNDTVCFEAAPKSATSQRLTVVEDAMGASGTPTEVVTPNTDLGCGTGEGNIYLKVAVDEPLGAVKKATLHLRSTADGSAAGDGSDVFFVPDNAWQEQTLTYANAPKPQGAALGRVGPVVPDTWYSVDVTSAVKGKGVYSFAFVPSATDQNGAHFSSKEAGASVAPYMQIEYGPGDPGAAGAGGGAGATGDAGAGGAGAGGAGTGGGSAGATAGAGANAGGTGAGGKSGTGGSAGNGGGSLAKGGASGGIGGGLPATAGAAGTAGATNKRPRSAEGSDEGDGNDGGCAVGSLRPGSMLGHALLVLLAVTTRRVRRGRVEA